MAPSKHNHAPPYAKEEKVLCFHGDLMYEAKIIDIRQTASTSGSGGNNKDNSKPGGGSSSNSADDVMYRVHYKGWKASWDDWVTADRIRKFTDDNKQLASQLKAQATMRSQGHHAHGKAGAAALASGKKGSGGPAGKAGSEMSSARGSEERAAGSSSFAGRGPRRGRDYELESPWLPSQDDKEDKLVRGEAFDRIR